MLVQIVEDVRTWLATRGIDAIVDDGPDALNEQLNYGAGFARVVFVPSSAPMAMVPPMRPGEDDDGRRQLWNVEVAYDVHIAAYDADAPNRRVAQQNRVLALLETVVQGVHHAYYGVARWGAATWQQPRKNHSHGAELAVGLTLNLPLFDVESPLATPAPVPVKPET